jgi:hypothetical protein
MLVANMADIEDMRCHLHVRWSLTLIASFVGYKREPPRGKPVASQDLLCRRCSDQHKHKSPPGKPLVSRFLELSVQCGSLKTKI